MNDILTTFAPISLDEMSGVKLMNRTDTKFVTNTAKLHQLLMLAQQDYYVQEISGERNLEYDTTYFDTMSFDMYNQHQWGHTNRQKIRFRTYCISGLQFMEVKTKNNHGRTKKKRIEVGDMDLKDEAKRLFLGRHLRYGVDTLQPALNNHFSRITLVNKAKTERLTIDSGLRFRNLLNNEEKDMGPLVIIELKRDGLQPSPVLEMLRQLRIQPHGFSKYCMGSALTGRDHLSVNRFKRKLIEVNKLLK
ncbi:MAG: polyphosphate polymerase domain-containing protein [Prevotella sp.]|nr:polyphosphate polymerase domain-containing protein [Prevotella sp.]MBQ8706077.1 polyphosphate polymerase domain-containing protein [Paludibacteraceae bacterium]